MDWQQKEVNNFVKEKIYLHPMSRLTNLAARRRAPMLSLCIEEEEVFDTVLSKTSSTKEIEEFEREFKQRLRTTLHKIGPEFIKMRPVTFSTDADKDEVDKQKSPPPNTIAKKAKSVPLPSPIERKTPRKFSWQVSPANKSKRVSLDSTSSKLNEEIEKIKEIVRDKQQTEDLVSRMLPRDVYKQLSVGSSVKPQSYENVTIYFSDIVGYTNLVSELEPMQVTSIGEI